MSEREITGSRLAGVLKTLLEARGIKADRIVVFGSFVKGPQKKDSDIDIIVGVTAKRSKS